MSVRRQALFKSAKNSGRILDIWRHALVLSLLILPLAACAPMNQANPPAFNTWVRDFMQDARKQGIRQQTLNAAFADITLSQKVLELDKKQPESKWTFEDYVARVMDAERIRNGRIKYKENQVLLEKIGREYGVQPRFIVALWGMESKYGAFMGKTSIVQGLATLAYNGRRAEFFRAELMNAMRILDQGHIQPAAMKGSWAGAMGQTQFMPSSFLKFAVDYNGDGHKDIWNTREDVFASIANYLSKSGWNSALGWGKEIQLSQNFDESMKGRQIKRPVSQWQKLGVSLPGDGLLHNVSVQASIVTPERSNRSFLVYSNYDVLMQWNRSLFFATTVGMLSDHIAEGIDS